MKILHVSRFWHGYSVGGTELFQQEIMDNSAAMGVECDLIVLRDGCPGVHILSQANHARTLSIYRDPASESMPYLEFHEERTERDFAEYLREYGFPDVICFHSWGQAEAAIAKNALCAKIPYALVYHTPAWSCIKGDLLPARSRSFCNGKIAPFSCGYCFLYNKYRVSRVFYGCLSPILWAGENASRLVPRRLQGLLTIWRRLRNRSRCLSGFIEHASALISFSSAGDAVYLANGGSKEKIHRLAQGVGSAFEKSLAGVQPGRGFASRNGRVKVGILGRCCKEKGVHVIVQAFRLARELEAELHIVGAAASARYTKELYELAGGDGRIFFHEPVPYDKTAEFYISFDILAIPSIWHETGPITLFEGLASGCFVMGSSMLGQIDTLKRYGRVVTPNSPEAWASALTEECGRAAVRRSNQCHQVVRNFKTVTGELNDILFRCATDAVS